MDYFSTTFSAETRLHAVHTSYHSLWIGSFGRIERQKSANTNAPTRWGWFWLTLWRRIHGLGYSAKHQELMSTKMKQGLMRDPTTITTPKLTRCCKVLAASIWVEPPI